MSGCYRWVILPDGTWKEDLSYRREYGSAYDQGYTPGGHLYPAASSYTAGREGDRALVPQELGDTFSAKFTKGQGA